MPGFPFLGEMYCLLWIKAFTQSKQCFSLREGNPGNVLLTSRKHLQYFYQWLDTILDAFLFALLDCFLGRFSGSFSEPGLYWSSSIMTLWIFLSTFCKYILRNYTEIKGMTRIFPKELFDKGIKGFNSISFTNSKL